MCYRPTANIASLLFQAGNQTGGSLGVSDAVIENVSLYDQACLSSLCVIASCSGARTPADG